MRLLISLDSSDPKNVFGAATLIGDDGKPVDPQPELEVRDYGTGNERDEDGNLFRTIEP